jgi:hypothetical protein
MMIWSIAISALPGREEYTCFHHCITPAHYPLHTMNQSRFAIMTISLLIDIARLLICDIPCPTFKKRRGREWITLLDSVYTECVLDLDMAFHNCVFV